MQVKRRGPMGGRTTARVLLVNAAVLLTAMLPSCASPQPSAPRPVPTTSPTTSVDAARLAHTLLDALVLPASARAEDSAPTAALQHPSTSVNCPDIRGAHRFWTVKGYSIDSVQQFLERHVPPHLVLAGTGRESSHGTLGSTEVTFAIPATAQFATLDITAVPTSDGVALREDATAIPDESACAHA